MSLESVSLALAFVAGLVSFASPCVLALVPVYFAFLGETAGSVSATDGSAIAVRRPVLTQAFLFVAGFTIVFVLFGTTVGLLGSAIRSVEVVRQAAGVLVIVIGLLMTGAFGPLLDRLSLRVTPEALPATRSTRSLLLGALVAVGWTPCIGPVFGAILVMGLSSHSAPLAAVLLLAYSIGLAVPFIAVALALPRVRPLFEGLRRHHRLVEVLAGLFIIGMGVLILTNAFDRMASLFTFIL